MTQNGTLETVRELRMPLAFRNLSSVKDTVNCNICKMLLIVKVMTSMVRRIRSKAASLHPAAVPVLDKDIFELHIRLLTKHSEEIEFYITIQVLNKW